MVYLVLKNNVCMEEHAFELRYGQIMTTFLQWHINDTFLVAWFHWNHLQQIRSAVNREISRYMVY